MKTLHLYIQESLLDKTSNKVKDAHNIDFKSEISKYIKKHFRTHFTISDEPNEDGFYEVSSTGNVVMYDLYTTSLTNGLFVWKECRDFCCGYGRNLTSLDGAPRICKGKFKCCCSDLLTSLEGGPEKVMGDYICSHCKSLKSLNGLPKQIDGDLDCKGYQSQFNELDIRKMCDVKGNILC